MNLKLQKAKEILKKYNQEHLLNFYDYLDEAQKENLLNQILNINFKQILLLYEKSKKKEDHSKNKIDPLPYIDKEKLSKEEIKKYTLLGTQSITNNELAIITLAGGQGSRLGYQGPKGTFKLDINPKKSLFEITCDSLKRANKKYNVIIPWYIMTSNENNKQTIDYFEKNNFLNYPKEYIYFFKQEKLPIIDINGNLILEETYKIKEASNGNGDVYAALSTSNLLNEMENKNIKWVFIGGIDNVLLNNVDPLFLGIAINNNLEVISKSIFKENPNDKTCVFGLENNKNSIINYDNLTYEMSTSKDQNGDYLYRDENILAHLLSINAIRKLSTIDLKYHRAFKKNTFVNYEGMKEVPNKANTFKFEKFIFDGFYYLKEMKLLRVKKENEFAPIKDYNSIYNPENAKKAYEKFYNIRTKDSTKKNK